MLVFILEGKQGTLKHLAEIARQRTRSIATLEEGGGGI
jgi:hypothetical protein